MSEPERLAWLGSEETDAAEQAAIERYKAERHVGVRDVASPLLFGLCFFCADFLGAWALSR